MDRPNGITPTLVRPIRPAPDALSHWLGFHAQRLASGVFLEGRGADEVVSRDLTGNRYHDGGDPATLTHDPSAPTSWDEVTYRVDEDERSVTMRAASGVERTARHHGRYGCVGLPAGASSLDLPADPPRPRAGASTRAGEPWPRGCTVDHDASRGAVDVAAIEAALGRIVTDGKGRAAVVAQGGRLVAEAYAPGFDRDSRHSGWSMTKSWVGALVGRLVYENILALDQRAPVETWASDARRQITIGDLLRMSSGLDCPVGMTPWAEGTHYRVYTGLRSVGELAVSRPLLAPPGTRCAYQNSDPLMAARVVAEAAESIGISRDDAPWSLLFDPLGMDSVELSADAIGDFVLCGLSVATAQDWARFGQLYLDDGVWNERRLLPSGWLDYALTPAPADDEPVYGGAFLWLGDRVFAGRSDAVPHPSALAFGHYGQRMLVLPTEELVIVRMGQDEDDDLLMDAIASIVAAVRAPGARSR